MKFVLYSLFLSTLFVFTACEKSSEIIDSSDKIASRDGELSDKPVCLKFVFPISFTMPGGSVVTGNDREEIRLAIKAWYETHPDALENHTLIYPVDVIFKGEPITLQSETQMMRVRKACADKDKDRPCYKLVYPVTYLLPDGSTITGDDKESVHNVIKNWYADHPDVQEKPALQYPVNILFKGESITLQNEDGMTRVKKACAKEDDRKPCFKMVFPLTYVLPDGLTVTGQNREEIGAAIKSWYIDHPDVLEKPALQYPVVVILGDKRITLNNEQEIIQLKKQCK